METRPATATGERRRHRQTKPVRGGCLHYAMRLGGVPSLNLQCETKKKTARKIARRK